MRRSLNKLLGYTIQSTDGSKGKVKDFLFDENHWVVTYFEADFGNIFNKRRVLIPGVFLQKPDWEQKHFPVNLSGEQIEQCPGLEEHLPVSREYEKLLREHYNFSEEWFMIDPLSPVTHNAFAASTMQGPVRSIDEKDLNTNLRSFREIKGYTINTLDGTLGSVEDLIIDDETWRLLFVIVDTSDWLPWSKKVILPISCLKNISYLNNEVTIELKSDTIKDAPEYQDENILEKEYETALFDYYSKKNS